MQCIFCKEKAEPKKTRLHEGGRLSCCNTCLDDLEGKGMVSREKGKLKLKKSLLEILTS